MRSLHLLIATALLPILSPTAAGTDFDAVRRQLVAELSTDAARTVAWTGRAAFSPQVMAAMRSLLENLQKMTAEDSALNTSLGGLSSSR